MSAVSFLRYPRVAQPVSLTPEQVARAYDYPKATGSGRTIAIIELGGGFRPADLATYFNGTPPNLTAIGIDGGQNAPTTAGSADDEVLLDIEVAFSIAPAAAGRIYFCPNTNPGFLAGITRATADLAAGDAISISWGGPESSWPAADLTSFNNAFAAARSKGINVFAAAGDTGADDGTGHPTVEFPASSPNVVGCGGTRLTLNANGTRASETAWDDNPTSSATGGGVSVAFPGRDVPDVAGNADPDTGYSILVDGEREVVGGTSAVAPLYAGLAVLLSELVGPFDFLSAVTANPTVCFDVTSGSNGGFRAGPGRDETTGFGVVDGTRLLAALQAGSTSPPT